MKLKKIHFRMISFVGLISMMLYNILNLNNEILSFALLAIVVLSLLFSINKPNEKEVVTKNEKMGVIFLSLATIVTALLNLFL